MSLTFIGALAPRAESELSPPIGPPLQRAFVERLARAYDRSSFDAVHVGQSATSVDAAVLAQVALAVTDRVQVCVALPPNVVEPVAAARAVATLAALYPGRVHATVPVACDVTRQAELAQIVHALWRARQPIDHDGAHFHLDRQWSVIRPDPAPQLAVQLGDPAAAAFADVVFVPADTPDRVASQVDGLRSDGSARFGIAVRPVVAADEWAARELVRRLERRVPAWRVGDEHLLADLTRAHGGADPFVGTADRLADRLREYVDAGVEVFQLRGFDPLADVDALGQVAALVREGGDGRAHRVA